jgi:hypothetical protein
VILLASIYSYDLSSVFFHDLMFDVASQLNFAFNISNGYVLFVRKNRIFHIYIFKKNIRDRLVETSIVLFGC